MCLCFFIVSFGVGTAITLLFCDFGHHECMLGCECVFGCDLEIIDVPGSLETTSCKYLNNGGTAPGCCCTSTWSKNIRSAL